MTRRIPFQVNGLLALNGVSILGNAITEIAIPWLILEISGSPLLVATVMSAKILPLIFSIFFSAQLVDKYGAFRFSLLSDLVNFL
ncbi:MFS transporter, partial [Xenorhabdus bovienii]|nr:MFS transporter [Xenorhabdus bovienii]